ncbi:MAG: hypothetical protein WD336_03775 [Trueperaceae bacterium]
MSNEATQEPWGWIEDVDIRRLREARVQLHHALQVPAALHASRFAPREDQSETAFSFQGGRFVSEGDPELGWRAALRVDTLEVTLERSDGRLAGTLPLEGRTLEDAYERFAALLEEAAGPGPFRRLEAELPDHAVVRGAAFDRDVPALHALRGLYADAAAALERLRPQFVRPSPIRVWPHHFDIAVLDQLDAGAGRDGHEPRSIGVGMTPGDEGVREPYLYVTPWPYPSPADLPELPEGRWSTEGWVGAVLTLAELARDDTVQPGERVRTFLDGALRACRASLDGGEGA